VESVRLFFLFLSLTLAACMLLGLYKPWWVLWWEDVQNRKKVLLVYGTSAVFFAVVYEVLRLVK
jgi:hypothetical protein